MMKKWLRFAVGFLTLKSYLYSKVMDLNISRKKHYYKRILCIIKDDLGFQNCLHTTL